MEEATGLLALPEYPFSVFRYAALSVSKFGYKYDLNPQLLGKTEQAKIYYDRIEFFHDR